MQFGHLPHHGQAQPGAAVFARQAAVNLAKGLKQLVQVLLGNADAAVLDADFKEFLVVALCQRKAAHQPVALQGANLTAGNAAGRQFDVTAVGRELHRVGQQVVDNLLGLSHVQARHAQVFTGLHFDVNALGGGLFFHDGQAVEQQALDVHRVKLQRHHAGFHLGQVQNIVDQRQQVPPAAENIANVFFLGFAELANEPVFERL